MPGCTSFARRRSDYCHAHRHVQATGELPAPALHIQSERDAREERRRIFLERVESGNFKELYGPKISELIRQASAEKNVDDELGALRFSLAKAIAEVDDAEDLAKTVSTLARAIALILRSHRAATGETSSVLAEAIQDLLGDLDG